MKDPIHDSFSYNPPIDERTQDATISEHIRRLLELRNKLIRQHLGTDPPQQGVALRQEI